MPLERYRSEAHTKTSRKVYALIEHEYDRLCGCDGYHQGALESLKRADAEIYNLIRAEFDRVRNTLQLTAAQNICDRPVLAALGCVFQDKTAEGSINARWHGGCNVVDELESLAIERTKQAFGAQYANVQPHSGTTANQIVFKALLEPGDTILSFDTAGGGHPSHGGNDSLTRSIYKIQTYNVEPTSFVFDFDKILEKVKHVRPKLIMCGASAYPRTIDFNRFRAIADEVGAFLLADVSHIAGQIIAGIHPSPINAAHVTTTSTYKAGGPRGGLILSGGDFQRPVKIALATVPLWKALNTATFPGVQGTPYFNNIAAKAVFFKHALSDSYRHRQLRIVENAKTLAACLTKVGFDVLTGSTDNHMLLLDVHRSKPRLNGDVSQKALQDCGIVVDSYRLPYQRGDAPAAGLRLGTPIVTLRGMKPGQMEQIAAIIETVLDSVQSTGDETFELNESLTNQIKNRVKDFCSRFPLT